MATLQAEAHERTISGALLHVFEAGQRVVLDRIELARLDALASISQTLRTAFLVGVGVGLLTIAWFTLTALAIFLLQEVLPLPASLAAAAVLNAAIGIALVLVGAQRRSNQSGFVLVRPKEYAGEDSAEGAARSALSS